MRAALAACLAALFASGLASAQQQPTYVIDDSWREAALNHHYAQVQAYLDALVGIAPDHASSIVAVPGVFAELTEERRPALRRRAAAVRGRPGRGLLLARVETEMVYAEAETPRGVPARRGRPGAGPHRAFT